MRKKIRDKSKYQQNPNIKKVTESNIQFTKEFKLKAIKAYQEGQAEGPSALSRRVTKGG